MGRIQEEDVSKIVMDSSEDVPSGNKVLLAPRAGIFVFASFALLFFLVFVGRTFFVSSDSSPGILPTTLPRISSPTVDIKEVQVIQQDAGLQGDWPVVIGTVTADAQSFVSLGAGFAKDADHVFNVFLDKEKYPGFIFDIASAATFEVLGYGYSRDGSHVYYSNLNEDGKHISISVLETAEASSFRVFDGGCAEDSNRTYIFGAPALFPHCREVIATSTLTGPVYTSGLLHTVLSTATTWSTKGPQCVREEGWADLASGDYRIETSNNRYLGTTQCRRIINIGSGKTGRILALYPDFNELAAKWVTDWPGEYGVGKPEHEDPFTSFMDLINEKDLCGNLVNSLDRSEIIDGKKVYVVRHGPFDQDRVLCDAYPPHAATPYSYAGFYVKYFDATTFLPVRYIYFNHEDEIILHAGETELLDGKVMSKQRQLGVGPWTPSHYTLYSVAEIIERTSAHDSLFDQVIPKGYTLQEPPLLR